jgi:hypothetical protein
MDTRKPVPTKRPVDDSLTGNMIFALEYFTQRAVGKV